MIVAHNPDLHELALSLAADGAPADVAMLRRTFPPGALAMLTLEIEAWSGVRPGSARLDEFTTPIDLA
jgi:phosphohistidine phosphatase